MSLFFLWNDAAITDKAKSEVLKLAERMARSFFAGVTTSTENMWRMYYCDRVGDDIRLMTSTSFNDPGRPPGVVLCASTSFWVPVSSKTLFDFLRDENTRTKVLTLSTSNSFSLFDSF